jgi:hypothetical protein
VDLKETGCENVDWINKLPQRHLPKAIAKTHGSIKGVKLLDQLSDYKLPKKGRELRSQG